MSLVRDSVRGSTKDREEITMRTIRIAVAGATGNIGALTVAALEHAGQHVVRISRSLGVARRGRSHRANHLRRVARSATIRRRARYAPMAPLGTDPARRRPEVRSI